MIFIAKAKAYGVIPMGKYNIAIPNSQPSAPPRGAGYGNGGKMGGYKREEPVVGMLISVDQSGYKDQLHDKATLYSGWHEQQTMEK